MPNVPPIDPPTPPTARDETVSLTDHAVGSDTISIIKIDEPTT